MVKRIKQAQDQKLEQKQRLSLLQIGFVVAGTGILIAAIFTIAGLFNAKDSAAIPVNAASFSEECYTVSDGNEVLYNFNKNTGGPSAVGNTSIGSPEASSLNLIGDSLFLIDSDEFGHVNLSTGAFTVINSSFLNTVLRGEDGNILIDDIDAMTVDNEDVFWVASRDNNDVDPSYLAKIRRDGSFIQNAFGIGVDYLKFNGPAGFPSVLDAMAYDPIQEVLYACANDGSGNPTYNNLMAIDPATGVGTFIGNFNIGDVEGLGFDGEGNMYATTGSASSTNSNRNSFFSVNKRTAIATRVFTFPQGTDFETCDCVIGYKNTIKGTVYFDADESAFQNNGEGGYEGVTVNLYYDENNNGQYDVGTDGFVRSVETNSQGQYILFDAWESGTLNYVITIDEADLPTGASLTTDGVETASFSSGNNTDLFNDFGYKISGASLNTISGFVYGDEDSDQAFDNTESGLESVTVFLYQDVNNDGVYTAGVDDIISSRETDADGAYSFERPYMGGVLEVELNTSANGDAEQDGNSMSRSSGGLDFGDKMVGMIFSNASIPQGAVIEEAYFEVVSNGSYSSSTTVSIYAEDTDNPNTYNSSNNNMSGRTPTTANQSWTFSYWSAADLTYKSPDITSVVQEVIDRSGWTSGNDINIITTQTSGNRVARSYNNSASDAPKLIIKYSDASLSDNYLTFVDESTLPVGSSFTTDNIETASFSSGGNTDPNNNFGVFRDMSSFNTISGTVFLDNDENGAFNGSDLGENNITVCLFDDMDADGLYDAQTDELLQVIKTDGDGNYSFEEEYNPSFTRSYSISQSSDDADGSSLSVSSSDMDIAKYDNAVRFQGVGIPQGATITSAYIEFTSDDDLSGSYSTLIEGIDVNNASTFSSNQNLSQLSRTNEDVTWSGSDSWSTDGKENTPSLTDIVQEIVDRSGWASGNSMGFILNEGSGERTAYSYDTDPANAPRLVITYSGATVDYVVIIKETNLPTGYSLTTDNIETASFSSGGNSDPANDFGYKLNLSGLNTISGTVFQDANKNAAEDNGETGVSGIILNLYQDNDCNGAVSAGDELIDTDMSDSEGAYSFVTPFNESLSKRTTQSSDDADGSSLSITSSDMDLGSADGALRFQGVSIPQGATISSAYLQFTAIDNQTGFYSFLIEGVDEDNAATFSANQNLNGLSRTNADETTSGNDAWVEENTYNSSSITTIVQEIVNRTGWVSGNALALVLSAGSGDRDAYTYDNDPSKAPQLIIEYTPSQRCYRVAIEPTSVGQGGSITTVSEYAMTFNSDGNTDSGNDFGIYYAPLPVDLISFSGAWNGSIVSLNWETASELNNDFFEILWSTDGLSFESIGEVSGNGTTPMGATYSFDHYSPESNNFYRLRQVDFDGTDDYSSVINLNREGGAGVNLEAFPNPFSDQLTVSLTAFQNETGILEIRSASGQTVYQDDVNVVEGIQNFRISNLGGLNAGTYLLTLKTPSLSKTIRVQK